MQARQALPAVIDLSRNRTNFDSSRPFAHGEAAGPPFIASKAVVRNRLTVNWIGGPVVVRKLLLTDSNFVLSLRAGGIGPVHAMESESESCVHQPFFAQQDFSFRSRLNVRS